MPKEIAAMLDKRGKELLGRRDFHGAAAAFREALGYEETIPHRNNLAFAEFMAGEPRQALQSLEPLLQEKGRGNPFTYALAARIYGALQEKESARHWLGQAVCAFDEGLAKARRRELDQSLASFCEYTVSIMQAAADLGEHRYVFELYRRWEEYHVSWENRFMAGVACFNTGRYKRAASLWAGLGHVSELFLDMQRVALLLERGTVPPFEIGYDFYPTEKVNQMLTEAKQSEDARRECVGDSFMRLFLLAWTFDDMTDNTEQGLFALVHYGEEWGEGLGRHILDHPSLPLSLKITAANALVKRGILRQDQPIEMVVDGERRTVTFAEIPVILEPDEELDRIVARAKSLRDSGKPEEAVALLEELEEHGRFYPPAMMTLANLLREQGEFERSLELMKALRQIAPEDPVVLFNLAALMLQMGDTNKARQYLEEIDPTDLDDEFVAKIGLLVRELVREEQLLLSPDELRQIHEENWREEVAEKQIPVNVTLARALRHTPALWLDCACRRLGLEPARRRREREKQLRAFLTNPANLSRVAQDLREDERELLRYLLKRGGWSTLDPVIQEFGSMAGDGYFWHEQEPASTLGGLWSRVLAVVGRTVLSGKRARHAGVPSVAIPLELREPLRKLLGVP